MTEKKVLTFVSHDEAYCRNCGGDFGDRGWFFVASTENQSFVQYCSKCSAETFYTIKPTGD